MQRFLLVVVAALAGVLPAGAAAVGAEPAAPQTWSVAPSSRTGPDGRAAFTYKLDPGATLTDYAAVSNYSAAPITVDLYASDAFTTDQGGFDLLPAERQPVDVGTWVTFDAAFRRLVIPSKSRIDVPFQVTVPRNATPGDHAGGIVASVAAGAETAEGNRVRVDRRAGARVYLRVTGTLAPAFAVERLDAGYAGTLNPARGGTVTATYRIRNTGNVRLTGRPELTVSGLFGLGRRTAATEQLPEILPGGEITTTVRAGGVWPLVRLSADLQLVPEPINAPGADAPTTTDHTSLWALPWPQLAVIVLAAALVWLAVLRRRAHHRALETARAAGRAEAMGVEASGVEVSSVAAVDSTAGTPDPDDSRSDNTQ